VRRTAWFVLALLLVGGCASKGGLSSHADPDASSAPTAGTTAPATESAQPTPLARPSSTVTVGPVAVPWKRPEEVRRYRAAMRPVATELQALASMSASTPLAGTRTAIRALSGASGDAAESLRTGSWAPDTRSAVNALIAALLAQQDFLDQLADKPDLAAIRAASDGTGRVLLATQAAAGALQKKLGIAGNPLDLASASPGGS